MGRYSIGIICGSIILFGLYAMFILTRKQPPEGTNITVVDPSEIELLAGLPEINQPDPHTSATYRNVDGDKMFVKAGGVADSGRWYGIRVDDFGRAICSPSSTITVEVEPTPQFIENDLCYELCKSR